MVEIGAADGYELEDQTETFTISNTVRKQLTVENGKERTLKVKKSKIIMIIVLFLRELSSMYMMMKIKKLQL